VFNRKRSRRAGLWGHTDFLYVWAAETISQFGAQISVFAVPLIAAITLDASPLEMGVLAAAGPAPRLAIGFIAGAWADRLPRRPIMIATDIGRMFSSAIVPIAALTGHFNFTILLLAAVLGGLQSVFFDAAWAAMLPKLVGSGNLTDATSKLMGSASLAQVLGPALGGVLVGWIGGPPAMWIPVITFAGSAWFLMRIRAPEVVPDRSANATSMWMEVREGLGELWREPVVRAIINSSMVLNFGGFIFLSVYVLFLTHDLGLGSNSVGLVFAMGGIGALLGTIIAPRLAGRLGVGRSILIGAIAFGASNLLVPLAFHMPKVALAAVVTSEFCAWMSLMVFNVNRFALRQAMTPDHLRGRMAASSMTLVSGATMLGSLAGGVIGDVWGVHEALYVGIVVMAMAALWVWRSPVPGIAVMPES
jgi:predicted MFS family arabinose efflux permease